jgi:hypothetical protein
MRIKFFSILILSWMSVNIASSQNWKNESRFQINYIHNWHIGEGSDRTLVRSNVGIQFSPQKISILNLDNNKVVMQQEVLKSEDKYFEKSWYRIYYIKNEQVKEIVLLSDGIVVFYRGEKGLVFANMEPKFIKSLPDISNLPALK